jgi:hypothetical protein
MHTNTGGRSFFILDGDRIYLVDSDARSTLFHDRTNDDAELTEIHFVGLSNRLYLHKLFNSPNGLESSLSRISGSADQIPVEVTVIPRTPHSVMRFELRLVDGTPVINVADYANGRIRAFNLNIVSDFSIEQGYVDSMFVRLRDYRFFSEELNNETLGILVAEGTVVDQTGATPDRLSLLSPRLFRHAPGEARGRANLEPETPPVIDEHDTLFISSPYLDSHSPFFNPLQFPIIRHISEQPIPPATQITELTSALDLPDYGYSYKNYATVEYVDLDGNYVKSFDPLVTSRHFGLRKRSP